MYELSFALSDGWLDYTLYCPDELMKPAITMEFICTLNPRMEAPMQSLFRWRPGSATLAYHPLIVHCFRSGSSYSEVRISLISISENVLSVDRLFHPRLLDVFLRNARSREWKRIHDQRTSQQ